MQDGQQDDDAPALAYAQRPKLLAATLEMRLGESRLIAQRGAARLEFPLAEIERVRVFFRPRNAAHRAFACSLRAKDGRSLTFDTLSWRATFEVERQDEAYGAFVRALVKRTAALNPLVDIRGGVAPIRYWLTALTGGALALALVAVSFNTLARGGDWPLALLTAGLCAYLAWWLGDFLRRNRPRRLAADALPLDLVP